MQKPEYIFPRNIYLFEMDSHYVAQVGLKFSILLLLPPDLWEYRCVCHPSQLQKWAFDSHFHAFYFTPNVQRVLWALLLGLQHKALPSLKPPRISLTAVQIAFLHSDLLWVPILYSALPASTKRPKHFNPPSEENPLTSPGERTGRGISESFSTVPMATSVSLGCLAFRRSRLD